MIKGAIWSPRERRGEDGTAQSGPPGQLLGPGEPLPCVSPTSSVGDIICQCFLSIIAGPRLFARLERNFVFLYFMYRDSSGGWEVLWDKGHWIGVTLCMTPPATLFEWDQTDELMKGFISSTKHSG